MNQSQSLVTDDQISNQVLSRRVAREGWQLPGAVVGAVGGELGGSRLIKRSLLAVAGTFTSQVESYLDNNEAQMAAQVAAVALDNVTNASDMMLGPAASSNNPNDTWQQRDQTQSFSDWWDEYWSRQPFPSGYTQSSITLLACFISTIIFLIVVGNLLVCIAIFTEKSLKPTQNWFIASLAVSDMLLGLIVMPFSLARELMGFWIFGPLWCDIHEAVDVLLTTASINTLCLISLDRYWSITQAVSYLKKRTPRRGALMIAFVWVFSAAVSLPPLFGWKKQSSPGSSQAAPQAGNTATNQQQQQQPTKPIASRDLPDQPATGALYVPYDKQEAGADMPSSRSLVVDDGDGGRRRRRERRITRGAKRSSKGDGGGGREPRDANRDQQPLTFPELINESELEFDSTMYQQQQQQQAELNYVHLQQQQPDPAASDAMPIEYPSCQLSDDVGYVLYSAIGSFYIPCAVMVFTYIKIFLAARSRARRAINKQSRAQQAADKAKRLAASRRTILGTMNESAAAAAAGERAKQHLIDGDGKTNSGYVQQQQQAAAFGDRPNEPMASFGRLVVIERRKSTNVPMPGANKSLPGAIVAKGERGGPVMGTTADQSSKIVTCEVVAKPHGVSSCIADEKQAATNSESTSMITVMSNSMAELPVTRFNFSVAKMEQQLLELNERQRQLDELKAGCNDDGPPAFEQREIDETQRKTAALLKAISQAKQDVESELLDELLPRTDMQPAGQHHQSTTDDKQLVTTPGAAAGTNDAEIVAPANKDKANQGGSQQPCVESTVSNSTNETCFMTIEEDSDNFASQTGRTIMMVAENAKQSSSLASRSQGIVMKMLPPTATVEQQQPDSTTSAQIVTNSSGGGGTNGALVCNNIACIRRANKNRQRQLDQYGTRNSSSVCGSVSSDGDDDDDVDDEEEADEDDDCDDDDELLTDEYNGYSVSCGLDPYCAAATSSTCVHCHECNIDGNQLQNDDYGQQHPTASWRQQEHFQDAQRAARSCQSENEAQSLTGDDNLSLTDYRSNEDNSSAVGHELRKTSIDKSPRSTCGNHKRALMFDRGTLLRAQLKDEVIENDDGGDQPNARGGVGRKRSSIGSRLARLGSGVPSLSIQSGGLLALAASQQQQADNRQQTGFGENTGTATRNLKALRQNFFNKLNQLTAKSPSIKHQNKSRCSTGKSSAQSSGSSYEQSVDCATTSNVHSIVENYNQEQTIGETDDYEPQTSCEAANVREQISSLVGDNGQQQRQQVAGLQDTWSAVAVANSRHISETGRSGDMMTIETNQAGRKKSSASSTRRPLKSGKNLSSSSLNNLHNDGTQSGVADDSISATSEMTGAKLIEHQLELDDGGSAALDSRNHMRVDISSGAKAANEGQSKPRTITSGGQTGPIKTNTPRSMGTTTISLGRQTGRAYLASDNERHKRKLAKARERRATLILGLIMTTFICSWMPFFTFYVVRAFCNVCRDFVSPRFEAFIFWMGYCNSAINPIIYTIFNRDFRKAFRKILLKCL